MKETQTELFDYLMVCNGHHWDPRWPAFKGNFAGEIMHSHAYKHNRPFVGKRVLVVGGGNSACDVAVECGRVADYTYLSMRKGHWFAPKFIFGVPADVFNYQTLRLPVPYFIREWFRRLVFWIIQGSHKQLGLQTPTYRTLEGHITVNSELSYALGHGSVIPKPGIDRVEGNTVHFTNGTRQDFDTIICATGYQISFPFINRSLIDWRDATHIPLWRKMFHPTLKNIYFIGLFQPLGCIWPLADYQAMLACEEIKGNYHRPANLVAAIENERKHPHHRFIEEVRHSSEVDYHKFRSELLTELQKCGRKPHRPNACSALVDR